MELLRIALALTIPTFFFGCTSQLPQSQSEEYTSELYQSKTSTPLFEAIEELRVMKIKIEERGGISKKEYGENLTDLVHIVENAYGNPKALAATKSAVEGHKLALKFWQCDQAVGYDEVHECQDKVLKSIFTKYPDIKAEAMEAVEGENLPFLSAGLDKDSLLQAIWRKTSTDTEGALQAIALPSPKKLAEVAEEQGGKGSPFFHP
jgi:hypothetical protein